MTDTIRLMLVDDQQMVRAGFRMVLDAQRDMAVVAEAGDGQEAIDLLRPAPDAVDVVLMDVRMPRLDGVAATEQVSALDPAPRVLVLTTFDLDEYVFAALRAGASGFLLKDAGPEELLLAIRAIHAGDSVVAPSATRRLLEQVVPTLPSAEAADRTARLDVLTPREREVLVAVGRGLSNGEIASELFLAEPTVKTHIGRILAKLDLRDRVQMVVLCYETGLVRVGD
ncbi:response regulator [Barrientosiimonas humi]|uniref:response regulator n=1 Tax=Barrientosiimonas humi TaxID=999931 RepID=UPI00370D11E6